jgi:hypothetical protein
MPLFEKWLTQELFSKILYVRRRPLCLWLPLSDTNLPEMIVQIAQRGEQAFERGVKTGGRLSRLAEIASAEEVCGGYDRRPHRLVFVRTLSPRDVAIEPKCEAHPRVTIYP